MTLPELFISHHITRPQDLATRTGIPRTYAYALWNGSRRLGANMARTIHAATGIPLADLLTATPPTPPPKNPAHD